MRGRQLRTLRLRKKANEELGDVHVRGTTEDLAFLSPRAKVVETQKYLKNVSFVPKIGYFATIATQSDSNTQIQTEILRTHLESNKTSIPVIEPVQLNSTAKEEKEFKLEPQSKFSIYLHRLKGRKLDLLSKQLFPEELYDNIQYLPDAFQSSIRDPISLNSTFKTPQSKKRLYKTLKNVTTSSFYPSALNPESITRHKFSQYNTEVRCHPTYFSTLTSRDRDSVFNLTDRVCKSTEKPRLLKSIK